MTVTTTGTIRASTYAMVKLLRDNVTALQGARAFPPGEVVSSQQTRVIVQQYTPRERISGLGATVTSFATLRMKLDVYDKDSSKIDTVSDSVIQVIKQNRNYAPTVITIGADQAVTPKGQFYMLNIEGGTDVQFDERMQTYFRSIFVSGLWYQSS